MRVEKMEQVFSRIKSGEKTCEIFLQVISRQFLLGVHYPTSGFVIPIEHLSDILEGFSNFLGESACASIFFHLGKEVGETFYQKFQGGQTSSSNKVDGAGRMGETYFNYFATPMLEEFILDRERRRGKILLKIARGTLTHQTPIMAYYVKGFVKAFFKRVLNTEPRILKEDYIEKGRRQFFEVMFAF